MTCNQPKNRLFVGFWLKNLMLYGTYCDTLDSGLEILIVVMTYTLYGQMNDSIFVHANNGSFLTYGSSSDSCNFWYYPMVLMIPISQIDIIRALVPVWCMWKELLKVLRKLKSSICQG